MRLLIILLSILILKQSANSQTSTENPMRLKQKQIEENRKIHCVIKQTHYVIKANSKGELNDKKELRARSTYNSEGMATISESFWPNEHRKNVREYNEFNKQKTLKGYLNDRLVNNMTFEYDSLGNKTKSHYLTPSGELRETKVHEEKGTYSNTEKPTKLSEIEIDTLNNIYYSRKLSANGEVQVENAYKMDGDKILEWKYTDHIQGKIEHQIYQYDENSYSEENIRYNFDGTVKDKFVSEYNDKNLKISSSWIDENGILKQLSVYEYEYCEK